MIRTLVFQNYSMISFCDLLQQSSPILAPQQDHPPTIPPASLSVIDCEAESEPATSHKLSQDLPSSSKLEVIQQLNKFSASSPAETTSKRPRKAITSTLISQLNEAFVVYEQQPCQFQLSQLAAALNLGYSTVLRKYNEFKAHAKLQQGRRLADYPKQYKKTRLARCLIVRALCEIPAFTNAKDLSNFIIEKFGLYYDSQLINRQMRKTGASKIKQCLKERRKELKEYLCDQCLLQSLASTGKRLAHFIHQQITFEDSRQSTFFLLVCQQEVKVQLVSTEITADTALGLIRSFWKHFKFERGETSYVIIRNNDIYWNQIQLAQKKAKHSDLYPQAPKIIMINLCHELIAPADHLLWQIVSKIEGSRLTQAQAEALIPDWIQSQQGSILKFLQQASLKGVSVGHICRK